MNMRKFSILVVVLGLLDYFCTAITINIWGIDAEGMAGTKYLMEYLGVYWGLFAMSMIYLGLVVTLFSGLVIISSPLVREEAGPSPIYFSGIFFLGTVLSLSLGIKTVACISHPVLWMGSLFIPFEQLVNSWIMLTPWFVLPFLSFSYGKLVSEAAIECVIKGINNTIRR